MAKPRLLRFHMNRLFLLTVVLGFVVTGIVLPNPNPRPRVEGRAVAIADRPGAGQVLTFEAPIGANAIAFDWRGAIAGAVEFRVLQGDRWTDWSEAEGDPDAGPDLGSSVESVETTSTPLVWVGGDVRDVQVRVTEGALRGLRAYVVKSETARSPLLSTESASATPGQPPILTRAQWGADESWRDCTPSVADSVRYGIVHHTATGNAYTPDEAAALIRAIYHHHRFSRGFCDIGYNFLIDKFGRIYEGRFGGIEKAVIGAHASGFNTRSFGVSALGNYQEEPIPSATLESLENLLAWKLAFHNIDARTVIKVVSGGSNTRPAGEVVDLWTIAIHQDVSATACPGQHLIPLINDLRVRTQRRIMSTPPYPLPGWSPQSGAPALLALDTWGGLHPLGSQGAVPHAAFWSGWSIARGAIHQGSGGYVLDGYGGLHTFGNAPYRPGGGYWHGWDIARGIAKGPAASTGYVLDGWGGIHTFGGIPKPPTSGYWGGWDIARALASNSTGTGGYVLDGWGGLHNFGSAPARKGSGYWGGFDIARAVALRADGVSGYVLDGWGGLHAFGGAPHMSFPWYTSGRDIYRGLVLAPGGGGGWVMDIDGLVYPFGSAATPKHSMAWAGMGIGRSLIMAP